tara:strand:+ start:22798 stop:23376 length:579 start_codon:yes stop_codon:yes gene_type:complete
MTRKVIVCFLPADSDLLDDHWLNRAAAYRAPARTDVPGSAPMVHTELFFPSAANEASDSIVGRSLGIHYGGQVFMAPKRFSKKQWIFRSLSCNDEQYTNMVNFAKQQVGGAFNYMGYYTPCGIGPSARASSGHTTQNWYCSELVAHALWQGKLLQEPCAHGVHPQVLFDNLLSNENVFHDTARDISAANIKI